MANVLASTLTGLPDVPYWRAAGTPARGGCAFDCMVYCISLQRKMKEDTRCWSAREDERDKCRVGRA